MTTAPTKPGASLDGKAARSLARALRKVATSMLAIEATLDREALAACGVRFLNPGWALCRTKSAERTFAHESFV